MILSTIKRNDNKKLEAVRSLYESAFPKEERRDFYLIEQLITEQPLFSLFYIEEHNRFVGFISCWHLPHCTYIEHFATNPEVRNHGYGSKILNTFVTKEKAPIVLEVEIPDNEMAQRRIAFYQRNGFRLLPYSYLQPPYHEGDEMLPMRIMHWGNEQSVEHFDFFVKDIYKEVYRYKV